MAHTIPSPACEGEPQATVTRGIRCGYWVDVTWGIMGISTAPWWRWSRKGAERKARREMARWKAEQQRESWTLT